MVCTVECNREFGIGEAYLIGHEELVGVVEALLVEEHPKNGTAYRATWCAVAPVVSNVAIGGYTPVHGWDDESRLEMRGGGGPAPATRTVAQPPRA